MKRIVFTLAFLLGGLFAMAQNSTQGKEFWFSFMQNGYKENDGSWVEIQVMISAKRSCSGTITNPRTSWPQTFTVDSASIVVLPIPEAEGYNENNVGVPSDLGLLLTATDTVSVFIANIANKSFDASFVLPIESLGSSYIVQCDKQSRTPNTFISFGFRDMETSAFLIVATEDNTVIDINPSALTMDGHPTVVNYSVTLDRGQTYFMRSMNTQGVTIRDFSGTRIKARDGKKIAVFNGNTLTTIPDPWFSSIQQGYDHIFEQALPVETWGSRFAITSSATRTRDQVKITAEFDNDTVWCNSVQQAVLNRGGSFTFWLYGSMSGNHTFGGGSCFVETSRPSMVYLYNTTYRDPEAMSQEKGDPSMVWIPPIEQKINDITFCTFNHDNATIDNHYVNIVVDSESVHEVYLDGVLLDANDFQPLIGNQAISYARVEISHGMHHLSCEKGLITHVYGFGSAKGYAYCVGANVENLTSTFVINGQLSANYHDGLRLCIGEAADFEVVTNYPVESVVWDFDGTMVSGGVTASHTYNQAGDFIVNAIIEGRNNFNLYEMFYDTLTMTVHVDAAGFADINYEACDEDVFEFHGEIYSESGYYEQNVHNANACDSVFHLTLDLGFTPNFEIVGTHWPIGGSETHISVNEYEVQLTESRARVDTVLWQIDCPNWYVVPHGDKGKQCTLYIHSYLTEPITLHAWAVNRCDSIHEEFFIQTSYYDVGENNQDVGFEVVPNPTNGEVSLLFGDLQGRVEVLVYNGMGQEVESFMMEVDGNQPYVYDMRSHPDGIYLLVAKHMGNTWIRKVVLCVE